MGGPYAPTTASFGGLPRESTDIPTDVVFIVLYIAFAATNMTIFQLNRRRGHKFLPNAALFGFCMARIVTLSLRIAWSTAQHNVRLAIAANIFVNAGILIVYVINIILAQRILRATHPKLGWNPLLRIAYKVLYVLIGGALAMVITASVLSVSEIKTFDVALLTTRQAYTLNPSTKQTCRDLLLAAITFLLVVASLPAVHLAVTNLLPKSEHVEHFGQGSMRTKMTIIGISGCLCMLIAGYKAGINWVPSVPITDSPWYFSKACFYVFNFSLEIVILCVLTFTRIDKKFFVPNGAKNPGDYTKLADDRTSVEKLEHGMWYTTSAPQSERDEEKA
jgi:hypothetical protein